MIAIKDMEMPRVCYECPIKQHCQIGISDGWRLDKRADDCPLVEIEERKIGKSGLIIGEIKQNQTEKCGGVVANAVYVEYLLKAIITIA